MNSTDRFSYKYDKIVNEVQNGNLVKAKVLAEQLYSNNPNNFDVICLVAGIEASRKNYREAIAYYSKALTITDVKEAILDVRFNLAKCLELTSQFSKAASCYSAMIECNPRLPESWFGLAQNEIVLGNVAGAEKAYQQVISLSNIAQHGLIRSHAFYALSLGKSELIELVTTIIREIPKSNQIKVQANLYFALANIYESKGDFENAFDSFSKANSLMSRSNVPYNHTETLAQANRIIASFAVADEEKTIAKPTPQYSISAAPIFIVGLPRSGSTLIESILSCAPNSKALGEVEHMSSIISRARKLNAKHDYPELVNRLSQNDREYLASHYLELIKTKSNERSIDKFLANFWNVGLIKVIFPNAKIVACEKNPTDACFSLYRQNFHEGHPYSHQLHDCADYHSVYKKLINHWQKIFPEQIHLISYEALVQNTELECQRLFEFCEFDWSSEYLEKFVNRELVRTASASQVREPINSKGLCRWKNYQNYLHKLIERVGV